MATTVPLRDHLDSVKFV